jgi:hypothetical protein
MSFETYKSRGAQLASVRDLIKDDAAYPSATALLAVHSAIALNDALLTNFSGQPPKGQDHMEAVRQIDKDCRKRRIDRAGIAHLKKLVSAKTKISYGPANTTQEQAQALAVAAERFETWVYKVLAAA